MPQIDFNQALLEIDGTPSYFLDYDDSDLDFIKTNGYRKLVGRKPNTLKKTVIDILNIVEKDANPEENAKQGWLIVKVSKANSPISLESEEISMIKSKAKKNLTPMYCVQVCDILEGKENPFFQN